jgi:hypothetical protein
MRTAPRLIGSLSVGTASVVHRRAKGMSEQLWVGETIMEDSPELEAVTIPTEVELTVEMGTSLGLNMGKLRPRQTVSLTSPLWHL